VSTIETAAPGIEPGVRVSTLELFFDLVFVLTVTQLTAALRPRRSGAAYRQGFAWWRSAPARPGCR